MLSSYTISNSLLTRIAFFTAKSARQTTPNLIQNPRLTARGIIKTPSKSYAHVIPQNLPNKHLYWNNTVQNRLRRKQYNSHRLYKLGINSIHDDQGIPLNNRTVQEVLQQLSNLRLIKQSPGRTLINLREIGQRFPQVMKSQDKDIVVWACNQINQRYLSSMKPYEFTTFIYLRYLLGLRPTQNLIIHMYKWIQSEVEQPSDRFKPKFLLNNLKYVFSDSYSQNLNDILYKKQIQFKLFQDIEPANKPLEELLPKLFSDQQLKQLKADTGFAIKKFNFLLRIPGGKGLYQRLEAV